jgi:hypothetical protein
MTTNIEDYWKNSVWHLASWLYDDQDLFFFTLGAFLPILKNREGDILTVTQKSVSQISIFIL